MIFFSYNINAFWQTVCGTQSEESPNCVCLEALKARVQNIIAEGISGDV